MLKYLLAVMLFIGLNAAVNAQSEEGCCSKDKSEVTKADKHCETPETVSDDKAVSGDVAGAMSDGKVKKEKLTDKKDSGITETAKEEKSCCSTDEKKADKPSK